MPRRCRRCWLASDMTAWFRPVFLRPVPGADGGARLRLVSTAADAAEHCFVLTAGSHAADEVRRAAER
eukprot:6773489-Alexandrium_andersonii.AAC.1